MKLEGREILTDIFVTQCAAKLWDFLAMAYKKRNCPFCKRRFMRLKSLIDHAVLKHSKNITFVNVWNEEKQKIYREVYNPGKN